MPDEPDTFTVVDETLSFLGKTAKETVYDNVKKLIDQVANYLSSGSDELEKDFEKEDFEKKLMK